MFLQGLVTLGVWRCKARDKTLAGPSSGFSPTPSLVMTALVEGFTFAASELQVSVVAWVRLSGVRE